MSFPPLNFLVRSHTNLTPVTQTKTQVCAVPNGADRPSLAWHPRALLLAFAAEGGGGDAASSIGVPGGGGFGSLMGGMGGGGRGQQGPKEENVRFVSVMDR